MLWVFDFQILKKRRAFKQGIKNCVLKINVSNHVLMINAVKNFTF